MTEAESLINVTTGVNYSDTYSSLNADVKGILKMAASAKAAMMVINYDHTGYGTTQAQTILDVLRDEYSLAMQQLKDKKGSDFVTGA